MDETKSRRTVFFSLYTLFHLDIFYEKSHNNLKVDLKIISSSLWFWIENSQWFSHGEQEQMVKHERFNL